MKLVRCNLIAQVLERKSNQLFLLLTKPCYTTNCFASHNHRGSNEMAFKVILWACSLIVRFSFSFDLIGWECHHTSINLKTYLRPVARHNSSIISLPWTRWNQSNLMCYDNKISNCSNVQIMFLSWPKWRSKPLFRLQSGVSPWHNVFLKFSAKKSIFTKTQKKVFRFFGLRDWRFRPNRRQTMKG